MKRSGGLFNRRGDEKYYLVRGKQDSIVLLEFIGSVFAKRVEEEADVAKKHGNIAGHRRKGAQGVNPVTLKRE
jgi:hypothetical protein